MRNEFNTIRKIVGSGLFVIGIGIFLWAQIVSNKDLYEWQNIITKTLWFYLFAVITYIIFFNVVPMLHKYFKEKSDQK